MKKIIPFLLIAVLAFSCKLSYIAQYDPAITANAVAARVYCQDSLYNFMINSPDKSYAFSQGRYLNLSTQLKTLYLTETIRPHGKILVSQAQRIMDQFTIFQNDHARNITLDTNVLRGYQLLMDDLFRSYIISQNNLEKR